MPDTNSTLAIIEFQCPTCKAQCQLMGATLISPGSCNMQHCPNCHADYVVVIAPTVKVGSQNLPSGDMVAIVAVSAEKSNILVPQILPRPIPHIKAH